MAHRCLFIAWSVLVATICAQFTACGSLSIREIDVNDAAAARYALSGDLPHEVDSLARPLVEHRETPGIVVGVLSADGETQFFGYGFANDDCRCAPDADTVFPVGSLSKGFLGAITATLVEEGRLSWDDRLETLLPDIPLSADARTITIRQLATHTSGLPRQPMKPRMLANVAQYLFTGRNFYRHIDRDYTFKFIAEFKAPRKSVERYSNLGYGLLGYIVERRAGVPLEALLAQKISSPIGLHATGYGDDVVPALATRAVGHAGDQPKFIPRGARVPDWNFTPMLKGSAAVHSTARDLLKFAEAHMSGHDALNETLSHTLEPLFMRPREAPAIAWRVDEIDGHRIAYQVGVVAGYASYIGLDTEHRTAVVVLQNSFNWTDRVGHKLLLRMAVAAEKRKLVAALPK